MNVSLKLTNLVGTFIRNNLSVYVLSLLLASFPFLYILKIKERNEPFFTIFHLVMIMLQLRLLGYSLAV